MFWFRTKQTPQGPPLSKIFKSFWNTSLYLLAIRTEVEVPRSRFQNLLWTYANRKIAANEFLGGKCQKLQGNRRRARTRTSSLAPCICLLKTDIFIGSSSSSAPIFLLAAFFNLFGQWKVWKATRNLKITGELGPAWRTLKFNTRVGHPSLWFELKCKCRRQPRVEIFKYKMTNRWIMNRNLGVGIGVGVGVAVSEFKFKKRTNEMKHFPYIEVTQKVLSPTKLMVSKVGSTNLIPLKAWNYI